MEEYVLETKEKSVGIKDLFKHKNYCIILLANAISRFGDSIDAIAYSWMVYQLTGSKLLMGTLFALNFIPNIVFSVFSGVFADYFPKKRTVILSDFGRGAVVTVTAVLLFTGYLKPWHLFLFTILNSTFETFSGPARSALIPLLLPKELFLTAGSFSSSLGSFAELLGMGLAGLLIAQFSISGAIFIDAATFFISFILIGTLKIKGDKKSEKKLTTNMYFENLKEGFKFIKGQKLLVLVIFLGAITNFSVAPINVLQPVYVKEILNAGPEALSIIGVAVSSGVILGGLVVGQIGSKFKKSTLIFFGFTCIGIAYVSLSLLGFITLAFIKPIIVCAFSFFIMGFSIPVAIVPVQTVMLEKTPKEMLGRVSSFMGVALLCSNPLGAFLTGVVSQYISIPVLYISMSIFLLGTIFITSFNKDFKNA